MLERESLSTIPYFSPQRRKEKENVMSIKEFCNTNVITAWEGETILEAARRMESQNVGAVIVVDDRMQPLGILTDRDIVVKVVSREKDSYSTLLKDVMSHDVTTLKENAGLMEATRLMAKNGVRRLPVVNAHGEIVGMLSMDDLLLVLEREFSNLSSAISHNIR